MAPLVTKLVDLLRNTIDPEGKFTGRLKAIWNILAIAIGIGVALIWQLNILPATFAHSVSQKWAGWIITGIAMGGVASGWHELFDTLSGIAKASHSRAQHRQEHAHRQEHKHGDPGHTHT
jgi:ABC-type nickel/cobalt efflux system permease component RcnA